MKKLLLSLTVILSVAVVAQAQFGWKNAIRGEGESIKRTIDLDRIDGVRSGFAANIYLTQGNRQSIEIEGQENILDNLIFDLENGILKIKTDRQVRNHDPVSIHITLSSLREVSVAGSGNIKTMNHFDGLEDLKLKISGSGNIVLDVDAENVDVRISGSGNMDLSGQASDLEVGIAGSGNLKAYELRAESSTIHIAGSGTANVHVQSELDARIAGSGDINYRGGASVNSKISGSGSVRSAR